MTGAEVADFAVKVGIPSFLGIMIVYYLLARLIPSLTEVFERRLEHQSATYERTIAALTAQLRVVGEHMTAEGAANRTHRESEAHETRTAIREWAGQTNAAISELSRETRVLSDAVNDLRSDLDASGHVVGTTQARRRVGAS